jgi:hypothetical protein
MTKDRLPHRGEWTMFRSLVRPFGAQNFLCAICEYYYYRAPLFIYGYFISASKGFYHFSLLNCLYKLLSFAALYVRFVDPSISLSRVCSEHSKEEKSCAINIHQRQNKP